MLVRCSHRATLAVLPAGRVQSSNQPAANIMDSKPNVNIAPFGMCMSPSNPQVASGDGRRLGRAHPAAVRADDGRAVDARLAHGHDRRSARAPNSSLHWVGWG